MRIGKMWAAVVLAMMALAPAGLHAQLSTGDIYGLVVDESGGVLPGVTVTLTGSLIGTMSQTTGLNGDFHFIRLSPGDYDVSCELDGFATHQQREVKVATGGKVDLRITMKPTVTTEIITVIGQQQIELKKTGTSANIGQDVLANVPTARDPWVIMAMVSGIVVDRVNIAGSEGGQQSSFTSRGDVGGDNAMWNMDGVTITDMGAVGSSPTYYDFDSFEEIQVTTGGNDPSLATGGMGINFVTKRGGDNPKGSARFYVTSEGLQGDNTKDLASPTNQGGQTELEGFRWNPAFSRVQIVKLRDYGLEIGGPIMKEKAWYWGAIGVQDIQTLAINKAPDNTQLENISFKVNSQVTEPLGITYMYYRGDKIKKGRNAGATRPPETTWNQKGPTGIHKVEVSNIVNPNFYINTKLGYVSGGFSLTPQGGLDTNAWRDFDGVWHGSQVYYSTDRPQYQFVVDTNYFLTAAGSHELKFGFSYRRADTESVSMWPGDGIVADAFTGDPTYQVAWLTRPSNNNTKNMYLSVYGGDTWSAGRLTLNLGLRFDKQSEIQLESYTPGNAAYQSLLPAVTVPQSDLPVSWSDISPRLGFTFDVSGDGKTIARASFARYADQMATTIWMNPIAGIGELDYYWYDTNNDHVVQPGEIDFDYGVTAYYYIDPLKPGRTSPLNVIDPDTSAPKRLELIVGGEREVAPNFAVGGNFVWRKADNFVWAPGTRYEGQLGQHYTAADYVVLTTAAGTLPDGTTYSVPVYRLNPALRTAGAGVFREVTNRPDYYQTYRGIEVFGTKRLSDKWMLNASLNFQVNRQYYESDAALSDPTAIVDGGALGDGSHVTFVTAGSGKTGLRVGTPRWQFNLNGMYQLPYGLNVAANVVSREGFPVVYYRRYFFVDPGLTTKDVPLEQVGSRKYPAMVELDFRLSKAVSLGDKGTISLDLDLFNILNKNTPLNAQQRAFSDSDSRRLTTGQVEDLMYPRTVRFGLRYAF